MAINRRIALSAGLGLGAGLTAAKAMATTRAAADSAAVASASAWGLVPNSPDDQSAELQLAIDEASSRGAAIELAPGIYRAGNIQLRSGTRLTGQAKLATIVFSGGPLFVTGESADDIQLSGIVFDGLFRLPATESDPALIQLTQCKRLVCDGIEIRNSAASGIVLDRCSGRISHSIIADVLDAGLRSYDSSGLDISGNHIADCGNNGIQIWTRVPGEDSSSITSNRIERVRASAGGSGQNGNGINVFRAGSVFVGSNRITDCAFSAVRGNCASNIQIIANSCERIGEVAIYAEFGFEGALIAQNLIDRAATGISVTNFNDGGRLAVVQGNLIRNLKRRESDPQDKRGEGICVEADASVSGNTIENAPTCGISIGWGRYMRDIAATGNVIRHTAVGIAVTSHASAGSCLVANNLISGATSGSVRMSDHGQPVGPDLAINPPPAGQITVTGNVTV